jgi:hypothetical protein
MDLASECVHEPQFTEVFVPKRVKVVEPKARHAETYVTTTRLGGKQRSKNWEVLTLHIHPKDIESLGAMSGSKWTLGIGDAVKDGGEVVKVLAFYNNRQIITPRLKITKSGWGMWSKTTSKDIIEGKVFRGPIQREIIPKVEIVRDNTNTPLMIITFPSLEQPNPAEELPPIADGGASLPSGLPDHHEDECSSTKECTSKGTDSSKAGLQNEQSGEMLREACSIALVASDNGQKGEAETVSLEHDDVQNNPVG